MTILAVINQKGGAGKTTTALNVGACLATDNRVLIVDTDPQGNLTTSAGINTLENDKTLYEVLKGQVQISDAIIKRTNYDILPTDIRQSGAELELSNIPGRDFLLKEALEQVKGEYDFIIIDCPPSLSVITLMGLTACDKVIIPVQAQYLALQGMAQLLNTIELVKMRMNPRIEIGAVVLTMYDPRKNLDNEIKRNISEAFPQKLLETAISHNVSLAEAPAYGKDILDYAPKSKGAQQYRALTKELMNKIIN